MTRANRTNKLTFWVLLFDYKRTNQMTPQLGKVESSGGLALSPNIPDAHEHRRTHTSNGTSVILTTPSILVSLNVKSLFEPWNTSKLDSNAYNRICGESIIVEFYKFLDLGKHLEPKHCQQRHSSTPQSVPRGPTANVPRMLPSMHSAP